MSGSAKGMVVSTWWQEQHSSSMLHLLIWAWHTNLMSCSAAFLVDFLVSHYFQIAGFVNGASVATWTPIPTCGGA